MPENKFNYFIVETITVVKAANKTDAEKIVLGQKNIKGKVLMQSNNIERISSVQAHKQIKL
jgi:hypothetical protein